MFLNNISPRNNSRVGEKSANEESGTTLNLMNAIGRDPVNCATSVAKMMPERYSKRDPRSPCHYKTRMATTVGAIPSPSSLERPQMAALSEDAQNIPVATTTQPTSNTNHGGREQECARKRWAFLTAACRARSSQDESSQIWIWPDRASLSRARNGSPRSTG